MISLTNKSAVWRRTTWCFLQKPSTAVPEVFWVLLFIYCLQDVLTFTTSSFLFLPLPVVIETVGSRHHPLAGYQCSPTDVGTPDLQAGLPRPLPLCGVGPAHNATGKLPQTTICVTHVVNRRYWLLFNALWLSWMTGINLWSKSAL